MPKQKLLIAADHAGFVLKKTILDYLVSRGYDMQDLGSYSEEAVDYPDYAAKLALEMKKNEAKFGILICGTGVGIAMAANRFPHLRAAVVADPFTAEFARVHNDANVIVFGARVVKPEEVFKYLDIFLSTPFSAEEKHKRRRDKLATLYEGK